MKEIDEKKAKREMMIWIAKKMKKDGCSIKDIAEALEITQKSVKKLLEGK